MRNAFTVSDLLFRLNVENGKVLTLRDVQALRHSINAHKTCNIQAPNINLSATLQRQYPYLLDIQSDLLSQLRTAVVIPLTPSKIAAPISLTRLNPTFILDGVGKERPATARSVSNCFYTRLSGALL